MGLHTDFNDVFDGSVTMHFMLVAAKWVYQLTSLFYTLLQSTGLVSMSLPSSQGEELGLQPGSDLARIALVCEGMKENPIYSYKYGSDEDEEKDCVVCLCGIKEGDDVRKLCSCDHVFHKSCLDGWLLLFNMNCPICRSPLVEDKIVRAKEREMTTDLLTWFS